MNHHIKVRSSLVVARQARYTRGGGEEGHTQREKKWNRVYVWLVLKLNLKFANLNPFHILCVQSTHHFFRLSLPSQQTLSPSSGRPSAPKKVFRRPSCFFYVCLLEKKVLPGAWAGTALTKRPTPGVKVGGGFGGSGGFGREMLH